MVKLNKITTKTGDDGTTGLVDGSRTPKSSTRIAAIGAVDEASCAIGLARAALGAAGEGGVDAMLARMQNDLFDLGADLATPGDLDGALRVVASQTDRLEAETDAVNARLAPLDSFILPGGTEAAARLHMARALARRAERAAVATCEDGEAVSAEAIRYLNRLSDLLFVLARLANDNGAADVLWVPGGSR